MFISSVSIFPFVCSADADDVDACLVVLCRVSLFSSPTSTAAQVVPQTLCVDTLFFVCLVGGIDRTKVARSSAASFFDVPCSGFNLFYQVATENAEFEITCAHRLLDTLYCTYHFWINRAYAAVHLKSTPRVIISKHFMPLSTNSNASLKINSSCHIQTV
jgi:hypothetical protein